jgi:dihydrofolate reductase
MKVSLIVAASENNVIGVHGNLPWKLPKDWQRFKALTMGHPVIMGRKTFESIGRPLPGRRNIVLSRSMDATEGIDVTHSVSKALELVQESGAEEAWVIGGGEIYREALPLADCVELTRVHATVEGDVSFPELNMNEWEETFHEDHPADEKHEHAFTFLTFKRKK